MAEHIKSILTKYINKQKNQYHQNQKIQTILYQNLNKELFSQPATEIINRNQLNIFFNSSGAIYQFYLQKEKTTQEIKKAAPQIKKIKAEVR